MKKQFGESLLIDKGHGLLFKIYIICLKRPLSSSQGNLIRYQQLDLSFQISQRFLIYIPPY